MSVPPNVVNELIEGAQSDIRQIINMLSTWKLSNTTMDFDEGKNLYVSPSPWHVPSQRHWF